MVRLILYSISTAFTIGLVILGSYLVDDGAVAHTVEVSQSVYNESRNIANGMNSTSVFEDFAPATKKPGEHAVASSSVFEYTTPVTKKPAEHAAATSSVSDDPLPAEKKSGQNADPSTSAIEHPAPIIKSPVGYGATIPSQKTDYGSSLKAQTAMEQTGKTISQDKNRQQEVTAPHPSSAEQIQQNRQNSGSNIPPTDTDRSIPPESPASNSSGSVLPSAEKSVTTPASANTYGGSGTFLFTGSGGSGSSSVSGGSGGGTGLSSYWRGIISGSTRLTSIASAASKMLSTKTASDDVIKVSEPMVKLDVSHHEGPPEAEDLQNRLKEDSEEKTVTSESHGAPEPYALELTIRQKQRLMDFQRKLNMRLQKMKASRSRH